MSKLTSRRAAGSAAALVLASACLAAACSSKSHAGVVPDDAVDDAGGSGGASGSGGAGGTGGSPLDGDGGVDPAHPEIVSRGAGVGIEAETSLAVRADGVVCVTWIAISVVGGTQSSRIGYRFSKDGGATWLAPASISAPSGRQSSDPVVTVGKDGAFRLAWIGFRRSSANVTSDMQTYVATATSPDAGFAAPALVSDPAAGSAAFADKPWIATAGDGRTIVTWAAPEGRLIAATSVDGVAWTRADVAPAANGAFRNLAYLCAATGSTRVHVVYWDAEKSQIFAQHSDDGASWGFPARVDVSGPDVGKAAFHDPTCVAAGDRVWFGYGLSADTVTEDAPKLPRLYAVRLATSTDGGLTIASRATVHDTSAGAYFSLPVVTRETSGALALAYHAGTGDADPAAALRLARSTDDGATFGPSKVLHAPTYLTFARSDAKWLGDYLGIAPLPTGGVAVSYVDNLADPVGSHVAVHLDPAP